MNTREGYEMVIKETTEIRAAQLRGHLAQTGMRYGRAPLLGTQGAQFHIRLVLSMVVAVAIMLFSAGATSAAEQSNVMGPSVPSLITTTPEEGFALAVKLSQKGVVFTQQEASVRKGLRDQYANDPNSLIAVSHVIAVHFQTIAEANDYWRK